MPNPFFSVMDRRKPLALLGLAMVVFLFAPVPGFKAFALDQDSSIFEKKSDASKPQATGQPLALPEESPNPSPGILSTLFRLVLALALVIGLIVLTVWGLKIIWEKRGWAGVSEENKLIRILSSTYLAPRKTVHLVEVGKRVLVLGVGHEEIHCLDVITEPAEVESLRHGAQQGFPGIFGRVVQKHETIQQEQEAQKMVEEGKQVVGGYVEKLKGYSKKKKDGPQGPEDPA